MIRPIPIVVPPLAILERKIHHAKMICKNYEDTVECKLAWETVDEIQKGIRKRNEKEKERILKEWCDDDPIACRDYDS